MYIALLDPAGRTQWARIGRVALSKSGRTLYYQGRELRGEGQPWYADAETGEQFHVQRARKDGLDRASPLCPPSRPQPGNESDAAEHHHSCPCVGRGGRAEAPGRMVRRRRAPRRRGPTGAGRRRTRGAPAPPGRLGRFGEFGGRFVPETLVPALDLIERALEQGATPDRDPERAARFGEILDGHRFERIVTAVVVADEDHSCRDALVGKDRGIVAGAARDATVASARSTSES